jgi:alpha-beta hydrolase superfamily lysophospholipase
MDKKHFRNSIFCFLIVICISSCSTSSFFYAPYKELVHFPDTTIYNIEEINFKSGNGNTLNGWFLKPKTNEIKATVLQLHGNGGNISYQYQFAEPLVKAGYQVMVFDYEGYGRSSGSPSQEKVLDDANYALDYIKHREDVKKTKLILFGQSLGGHLSCVVAALNNEKIDGLVVEGAFSGHERMAVFVGGQHGAPAWLARLLVPSKYDAIDYIGKVTVPKLIIHSTEDQTCPFFMSCDLYEKAVGKKEFWEIKGGHILASRLYPKEFVEHFNKLIE